VDHPRHPSGPLHGHRSLSRILFKNTKSPCQEVNLQCNGVRLSHGPLPSFPLCSLPPPDSRRSFCSISGGLSRAMARAPLPLPPLVGTPSLINLEGLCLWPTVSLSSLSLWLSAVLALSLSLSRQMPRLVRLFRSHCALLHSLPRPNGDRAHLCPLLL
jgi:hypothetical protein